MEARPPLHGVQFVASGNETEPDRTFARFVIWGGADIAECQPEDHAWILESLRALGLKDLESLNGCNPSKAADCCGPTELFLNTYDFGALVCIVMPASSGMPMSILDESIACLNLSERPNNCLASVGIETVGQLLRYSEQDLIRIRSMGRKSIAEVLDKLSHLRTTNEPNNEPDDAWSLSAGLLLSVDELGLPTPGLTQRLKSREIQDVASLVAYDTPSLRKTAGLSISEVQEVRSRLRHFDLDLGRLVPHWAASHLAELRKAFAPIIRSELLENVVILDPPPMSMDEEIDQILVDGLDDRKANIVRRFYGWDGGPGATLEQTGVEFDISRERVRQIVDVAIRDPLPPEFVFLDTALKYTGWAAPAEAEFVESELREARVVDRGVRLESLAETAKLLNRSFDWRVEEWAGRRIVVSDGSAELLRRFHSALKKRVSHFGTTRLSWVVDEMDEKPTTLWLDLACRTIEGLEWLGEGDWLFVPTSRNSVVTRLAKILSAAPDIDLEVARLGVLRDRRMEGAHLPRLVFERLCKFVPWCAIAGERLVVCGALPVNDEDTNERTLGAILREHGPVLNRRQFWDLGRQRGIEEVRFNQLLAGSNIITRAAPGFYALIGTPQNQEDDVALAHEDESAPVPVAASTATKSNPTAELDAERADFPDQVYRLVQRRQQSLNEQTAWSIAELSFTAADRSAIIQWGGIGQIGELGGSSRQWTTAAIAFLAFASEVTRTIGQEGELWPSIYLALNPSLRSRLFSQPGAPKALLREATETACRSLNIRHAFGREGEQAWMRTVFLQFGFSRSGWKRLPTWLDTNITLASVEDLLHSRFQSPSFSRFWTTLQRCRHGQLSVQAARDNLSNNPWVTTEDIENLISAAMVDRGLAPQSADLPSNEYAPGSFFGEPRLLCQDEPWRFELPLSDTRTLTENRYTLRVGSTTIFPLIRRDHAYCLDRSIAIDLDDLTSVAVPIDLRHKGAACWPEPLQLRLFPVGCSFAFYLLSTGRRASHEEVFDSPDRAYALLHSQELSLSETGSEMQRFMSGSWVVHIFKNGIPDGLRLLREEITEWEYSRDDSDHIDRHIPLRLDVTCGDGRWGEMVKVAVKAIPELVPEALMLNRLRVPLQDKGNGKFEGLIELAPHLENGMAVQIESRWKGRLRWVPSTLQFKDVYGFAIATGTGWMTLSEHKDIDSSYLKRNELKAALPDHIGDETVSLDSWAWMNGSHFWGRPRKRPGVVGTGVFGLGEPLRVSLGPYNPHGPEYSVARAILDTGVIARIERIAEEWVVNFRETLDLTADHDLWLWMPGSSRPQVIDRDNWRQEDGDCRIRFEGATPLGFAVSYLGKREGSRTGPGGFSSFASTLDLVHDWREAATWLRWWRAPLLHPELYPTIQRKFEMKPADSLLAWLGDSELPNAKLREHLEDEAWSSISRKLTWNWRPSNLVARQVFESFDVFEHDSPRLAYAVDRMIAVNPILAIRLLLEFSLQPGGQRSPLHIEPFERLRDHLLEMTMPSASETRKQREVLLKRTAEAMDVDERFVSKGLLSPAIQMAQRQPAQVERRDNRNLQVSISNRALVGRYLAVELLQKIVDRELR